MSTLEHLISPQDCALVLLDHQAGLAFAVQSIDRQTLLNNTVALLKTALAFNLPIVVSTSATKVYSGPLLGDLHALIPDHTIIERRNMNIWEDADGLAAIKATGRKKLLFSGMLTEACVTFPVLSALSDDYQCYVVGDACGGLSAVGHELALQRMSAQGAQLTSWLQVVLELQRDWTRKETYDGARAVIESNGGGYGIGLRYAKEMLNK